MIVQVLQGDCLEEMRRLAAEGARVQAIVTDPPYGLSFMGRGWDHAVPSPDYWRLAFDLLPPGGHLLAFGGSRTVHRMACAIEDAGFEIRDTIMWLYGQGFPKSLDVSKAIDKAAGAKGEFGAPKSRRHAAPRHYVEGMERPWHSDPVSVDRNGREYLPATEAAQQWAGWGTALKPSHEPIIVARKPLAGTVAETVLAHGTGALNIDATRVATTDNLNGGAYSGGERRCDEYCASDAEAGAVALSRLNRGVGEYMQPAGRWPANVVHDGSDEVEAAFAAFGERGGGFGKAGGRVDHAAFGGGIKNRGNVFGFGDVGTASRFFYCAKASKTDRAGSKHPTVKPVALMRWLVRLVTPAGGTVLDPFAGSGSTLEAAMREGFDAIGIERESEYHTDCLRRVSAVEAEIEAARKPTPDDTPPLLAAMKPPAA